MNSGDYEYIWQSGDWPNWRFDLAALAGPMAEVSRAQGLLMGRLADVGMVTCPEISYRSELEILASVVVNLLPNIPTNCCGVR